MTLSPITFTIQIVENIEKNEYIIALNEVQIWRGKAQKPVTPGTYDRVYVPKDRTKNPNEIWLKKLNGIVETEDLSKEPVFLDSRPFAKKVDRNTSAFYDPKDNWKIISPGKVSTELKLDLNSLDPSAISKIITDESGQPLLKITAGEILRDLGFKEVTIENVGIKTKYDIRTIVSIVDFLQQSTFSILYIDNDNQLQRATRRKNPPNR